MGGGPLDGWVDGFAVDDAIPGRQIALRWVADSGADFAVPGSTYVFEKLNGELVARFAGHKVEDSKR